MLGFRIEGPEATALLWPPRPDNALWNYNFMGQKHNPTMKYSLCAAGSGDSPCYSLFLPYTGI